MLLSVKYEFQELREPLTHLRSSFCLWIGANLFSSAATCFDIPLLFSSINFIDIPYVVCKPSLCISECAMSNVLQDNSSSVVDIANNLWTSRINCQYLNPTWATGSPFGIAKLVLYVYFCIYQIIFFFLSVYNELNSSKQSTCSTLHTIFKRLAFKLHFVNLASLLFFTELNWKVIRIL